jgi:rubredoxin
LSAGSVAVHLAALRFFYCKTLKRAWSIADTPYPKGAHHLPTILSKEEVARLIQAAGTSFHRTLLMTLYATGVRRAKFVDALEQAFQNGQVRFEGDLKLLAQPKIFAAWLRPLFRQDWVVYLKRPFGGPEYVLHYRGRYTHRVAISNHRLVSFTNGQVTFRWRDSAHHNEQKLLSLSLDEFLCRFLLHILPKGLVRIRNFGFLANRKRATFLPLCFQLLGPEQQPQAEQQHASSTQDCPDLWRCPKCGGPMKVIERLTAPEIQLRSPPQICAAA